MDLSSLACVLASFLFPSVCSASQSASFTLVSGSTKNCLANFMVSRSPQVPDTWLVRTGAHVLMCIHGPMWIHGRTFGPVYGIVPGDAREQSQFDLYRQRRVGREKAMPPHGPKICANTRKGASDGEMPVNLSLATQ